MPFEPLAGMETLDELCMRVDILNVDDWIEKAARELKPAEAAGSRALAAFITDLIACRSPRLLEVLAVALQIEPTPELVQAVRAAANAKRIAKEPLDSRFEPELTGPDGVAWAGETHDAIRHNARLVLDRIAPRRWWQLWSR